jgi:hypothetical protein
MDSWAKVAHSHKELLDMLTFLEYEKCTLGIRRKGSPLETARRPTRKNKACLIPLLMNLEGWR